MTKVLAGITVSVDGYVAGPNDVAGNGLGDGGERLHYWVFGGPWTYDNEPEGRGDGRGRGVARGGDGRARRGRRGRWTYEAANHWGDENPWGIPLFIVTHRPEEQPDGDAFTFVSGSTRRSERAREAAGDKDVHVMGGADVIRQALEADLVDELTIIVAPVVLGGGKRLFEGFRSRSTSSTSACASRGTRPSSTIASSADRSEAGAAGAERLLRAREGRHERREEIVRGRRPVGVPDDEAPKRAVDSRRTAERRERLRALHVEPSPLASKS
jgi:dihydrofolate reductase